MGVDKAAIRLDGERLADRLARALGAVCPLTLEVGPGWSTLPALREHLPDQGPLYAVVAGWSALGARGHRGPVLVLAVDLPLVTTGLLTRLAGHPATTSVVPVVAGRPQPLCARYSPPALSRAAQLAADGRRSMHALLEQVEVVWLSPGGGDDADAESAFEDLEDVDRPEDLTAARRKLADRRPGRTPAGGS